MKTFALLTTILLSINTAFAAESVNGSGEATSSEVISSSDSKPAPNQKISGAQPQDVTSVTNVCTPPIHTSNLYSAPVPSMTVYTEPDPLAVASTGRIDRNCQMTMDPQFGRVFQTYIPRCAAMAAAASGLTPAYGGRKVASIDVGHIGGYNKRPTNIPSASGGSQQGSSWSRHATGEAVDLSSITLKFNDGSYQRIELTKETTNPQFYDAFRECWNNSMKGEDRAASCTCSIACPGHPPPPMNELHDNHLHISYRCSTPVDAAGKPVKVAGC